MTRRDIDHYTGCMLGGAAGDALGAPVEFKSLEDIRSIYGPEGVTGMEDIGGRGGCSGVALFTDDTQMTLFTAEGLLRADTRWNDRGLCNVPSVIHRSYLRWLLTQGTRVEDPEFDIEDGWLIGLAPLHEQRSPGLTCISALASGKVGTIEEPINNSKGCGGVMRVAPVGLFANQATAFELGCQAAAITHGHPSGYLSAGFQSSMIHLIIEGRSLDDAIDISLDALQQFPGHEEARDAVERAVTLGKDPSMPRDALTVESLGHGWVAEEALSIALFCALAYEDDFASGVCMAVNHGGDSDSTGAMTGNILGALNGVEAIPPSWIEGLELRREIETLAGDLLTGYRGGSDWWDKYPGY